MNNLRKNDSLEKIKQEIEVCRLCNLCKARTNAVPGIGNPHPILLLVGEGPGRDEDLQREPFVGLAGQLLTKMLAAIDLKREDVFITNVVKCRPPGNRTPLPDEVGACNDYLERQIVILNPKLICTLGSVAAKAFLNTNEGITKIHGRWFYFKGIPLLPTFHPAYLLRNPEIKKASWEDLKIIRAAYDIIAGGKEFAERKESKETEKFPPDRQLSLNF